MPRRSWVSAAGALVAAIALGACSSDSGEVSGEATLRVYVSLPLTGPSGPDGKDAADGAELALADSGGEAGGLAVEAVLLDDAQGRSGGAGWTPARAAANARAATEDSTAIAYLGDLDSGATRASLPWTNEARLLQVSPGSSAVDLVAPFAGSDQMPEVQRSGERSFGRVIPADDAQAEAAALWAERTGIARVATLSDGTRFGNGLVDEFESALEHATLTNRAAGLLYFGGEADTPPASLTQSFPGTLMVSDAQLEPQVAGRQQPGTLATSAALDPTQLPPRGQEFVADFEHHYGRAPGRYAAYGYEAMAVILDSIDRASGPADRPAVIAAFFETADRDSILGSYSIDEVGDTTLDRLTGYEVRGGRVEPVAELPVPR